jgi:hypothetical protein
LVLEGGELTLEPAVGWDGSPATPAMFVGTSKLSSLYEVIHEPPELELSDASTDGGESLSLDDHEFEFTSESSLEVEDPETFLRVHRRRRRHLYTPPVADRARLGPTRMSVLRESGGREVLYCDDWTAAGSRLLDSGTTVLATRFEHADAGDFAPARPLSRKEQRAQDREIPWREIIKYPKQRLDEFIKVTRKEWDNYQKWAPLRGLSDNEANN